MVEDDEYHCFIGNLSWLTSDRGLKDIFEKFGNLVDAKVVLDKFSGRSRGYGFVTFDEKRAMEDAIEAMNGMDLDGRAITVDKAQPQHGSGRDFDSDRPRNRDRDQGRDRDRGSRDYGGGRGSGGDCFNCGKPGHFARECPSEGGRGGRYGPDRNGDRYGSRSSRDGGDRGGGERFYRDRSRPYDRRRSEVSRG